MSNTIFLATFDSRSYSFFGSGRTAGQAFCALDLAVRLHTTQNNLNHDWYDRSDYNIKEMTVGEGYRDETQLTAIQE
jgi:hypothetical protein